MNIKILNLYLVIITLFTIFSCERHNRGWIGKIENIDGITIIKNPSKPLYKEEIFNLEEDIIIGVDEGREEFMFTDILSMDIDQNENIYVLDRVAKHVRVFDKNGEFIRSIGSEGQGPGEIQYPHFIQVTSDNELIIHDPQSRHFLFFSLDGKYLRQISTSRIIFPIEPVKFNTNKEFIGFLRPPPSRGAIELIKTDSKLENITIISKQERNDSYLKHESIVMRPSLLCTVSKDNIVVWGNSAKYELYMLNPKGELTKKIVKDNIPIRITKKDKVQLRERFSQLSVGKLGFKPIFPNNYPCFQNISIDSEGKIFVETYERVENKIKFFYYDIFDSEGRYIAKVPLKHSLLTLVWSKSYLYAVEQDEDGFKKVKRYKVRWELH